MKIFCGSCNVLVGRPHGLGHSMLTYKQLNAAQKGIVAIHLGTRLARVVEQDPVRIVMAFVSALEDANQHDFSRIVQKQWAALLKH